MSEENNTIIIKKYANRRLYHTGISGYVTLDDLAEMVRKEQEFQVVDAKTGEDLTRSVLTQIIFEQENSSGDSLLPISFLRQLISLYDNSVRAAVPSYLEATLSQFMNEQEKIRDMMSTSFGVPGLEEFEKQAKQNMAFFQDAITSINPFMIGMQTHQAPEKAEQTQNKQEENKSDELSQMREQMKAMQAQLDKLN